MHQNSILEQLLILPLVSQNVLVGDFSGKWKATIHKYRAFARNFPTQFYLSQQSFQVKIISFILENRKLRSFLAHSRSQY